MNVARQPFEIGVAVDVLRLERPLKEMAAALLLLVDGFGVRDGEGLHDLQTGIVTLDVDKQMVMVGHQAVGNDFDQLRLEILAHLAHKKRPVVGAEKDRLAVYAAVVDVIVLTGYKFCDTHRLEWEKEIELF